MTAMMLLYGFSYHLRLCRRVMVGFSNIGEQGDFGGIMLRWFLLGSMRVIDWGNF